MSRGASRVAARILRTATGDDGTRRTVASTILIIDDDESVRSVVRRTLERAGYRVLAAEDGRRGVQVAAEEAVDLVITDIFMPEMDGIEAIQTLRATGGGPRILAISGGAGHLGGTLDDARLLGADAVLPKPFTPDVLRETVAGLLGRRTAS